MHVVRKGTCSSSRGEIKQHAWYLIEMPYGQEGLDIAPTLLILPSPAFGGASGSSTSLLVV